MDKFTKVTVGFVTQTYEKNDKGEMVCVEQEFFAGDEVSYENEDGYQLNYIPEHIYQSYDMVQPKLPKQFVIEDISTGAVGENFWMEDRAELLSSELAHLGYKIVKNNNFQ